VEHSSVVGCVELGPAAAAGAGGWLIDEMSLVIANEVWIFVEQLVDCYSCFI